MSNQGNSPINNFAKGLVPPAEADTLRGKIIAALEKDPITEYNLDSLFGEEVPPALYDPEYFIAIFRLNVRTRKLSVLMDNNPDKDGQPGRSGTRSLTPEEFHSIAAQTNIAPELKAFRTQADWDQLYDDTLLDAIKVNDRLLAQKKEYLRIEFGALIPEECFGTRPKRNIQNADITIVSPAARFSWLQLQQKDGEYRIISSGESRVLSDAEAVFAEMELERLRGQEYVRPELNRQAGKRLTLPWKVIVEVHLTDGTSFHGSAQGESPLNRLIFGSHRQGETTKRE